MVVLVIYWMLIGLLVWSYYMLVRKEGREILGKVFWDINCEDATKEIAISFWWTCYRLCINYIFMANNYL